MFPVFNKIETYAMHLYLKNIYKKTSSQIVGFLKTSRFLSYSATVTLSQIFPGARTEGVFVHLEFKGLWRTLLRGNRMVEKPTRYIEILREFCTLTTKMKFTNNRAISKGSILKLT